MKILCVIVLYKCKLEDSKSYQSLLRDKDITIFAYDNSPTPQEVNVKNVIYVHDSQNSGLGVAYNKAAQYANVSILNGYCYWIKIPFSHTKLWIFT